MLACLTGHPQKSCSDFCEKPALYCFWLAILPHSYLKQLYKSRNPLYCLTHEAERRCRIPDCKECCELILHGKSLHHSQPF